MNKVEIFPWNDRFCTRIPEIDEQHRQLVDLLNTLVGHIALGGGSLTTNAVFDELKRYADFHFRAEEAIWRDVFVGDSWEAEHEQSHQRFTEEISGMVTQSFRSSPLDMMREISRSLTRWLALHILEHDARMAKVVLAVRSGCSLQQAKTATAEEMAGPTREVIDTVLFMYDRLADRTLQLSTEINKRLVAEQHLVDANTELQAKAEIIEDRNAQLNAMFNLSPDGFVAFSREGRIKFVNPAFQAMTGISPEEIMGGGDDDLDRSLQRHGEVSQPFPGLKRQPSDPAKEPWLRTITLHSPRKVVLQVIGIASDSVGISQILYFRDVTQESTIDQMKSEFLSTAAHELRNPMASIYGFSEVLMTQDLDSATRNEITGIILSQSEMMVSILNELLDLARIEARQGKDFNLQKLSLQGLIEAVINGYHVPPGRSRPTLVWPNGSLHVRVDREKFMQAVTNVLANAYKYSPGGGTVEITVPPVPTPVDEPESSPPMVAIRIADQGIGMSPEQVERVGERFYRADRTGAIPGTGLGMSIVKEIVELHRGQISVTSRLGVGTTVELLIPLAPWTHGGATA